MFFKKQMITNKIRKRLLAYPNVNGVFFGQMKQDGNERGQGLVVTVDKKLPESELKSNAIVPRCIDGFPVDVIEVGKIKALDFDPKVEHRPFPMGVSVGHVNITAGTAGALVKLDNDFQNTYLLSNNHVLADVNKGKIGDVVCQPGPYDDSAKKQVGVLHKYIPIEFEGCSVSKALVKTLNYLARLLGSTSNFQYNFTVVKSKKFNLVDCALAKLDVGVAIPQVAELGEITGMGSVGVGETVWKSGRTTGIQSGPVISTNYTTQVDMGDNNVATFTDQILISKPGFSAGGDSGSSIVVKSDNGLKLVGLLFAGSEQVTIGNKINNVFDLLEVHL